MDYNDYNNVENNSKPQGGKVLAIIAFVLSILSGLCCVCYCGAIPLAIISIILAIVAIIKYSDYRGLEIASIIISGLSLIMSIIILLFGMPALVGYSQQMVDDYNNYGTIPEWLEDSGMTDEEIKEFMDAFVEGYEAGYSSASDALYD